MTSPDTAPTEKDLSLVIKTFDQVVPIAGLAADLFYDRLFEIAPGLRAMFPKDMRDQKRKLFVMMATAVQGLHDLDRLVPQVKVLGARHAGYGVRTEHYAIVGEALIWTLERGLGKAFTPRGGTGLDPGLRRCSRPRCRQARPRSPACRRRNSA